MAAAVLAAAGTGWSQDRSGPPFAMVRVAEAKFEHLQNRAALVGRLREVRRSVVAAEVTGKIVEMLVDAGDVVTGGRTVLARIDSVWSKHRLALAEANLAAAWSEEAEARAVLVKSTSDLEQIQNLVENNATSDREYKEALAVFEADEARLKGASARIRAAESERDLVQSEYEKLTILAPFDGVVVAKMVEVGEWADKGTAVAEIISRGSIDAVIDVPERMINSIKVGIEVPVFVEALSKEVTGQVEAIIPAGAAASRTFPVKIRIDDQGGRLKAAMSVVVRVPTSEKIQAVTVPRDAVLQSPRGPYVWISAAGRGPVPVARSVPVKVLFGKGDRYAVHAGGQQLGRAEVVIEGGERILFSGQPLRIVQQVLADSPVAEKGNDQAGPAGQGQ